MTPRFMVMVTFVPRAGHKTQHTASSVCRVGDAGSARLCAIATAGASSVVLDHRVAFPLALWMHRVTGVQGGGHAHARDPSLWRAPAAFDWCSGSPAPGARWTVAAGVRVPAAGAWEPGLLICHPWVSPL